MKPVSPLPLPPELIISIADLLPLHATGCFALCSRYLENLLGPSCWGKLREKKNFSFIVVSGRLVNWLNERLEFLSLLARDLPQYFVCPHQCEKLHHRDAVILSNRSNANNTGQLDCISKSWELRPFSHGASAYRIERAHVQLALKRHDRGEPHGISLDGFLYDDIVESIEKHLGLVSAECRIGFSGLILRFQRWLVVPVTASNLETEIALDDLCATSDFDHWRTPDAIKGILRCRIRNRLDGKDSCDHCAGIFDCCPSDTHVRIDSQDYGEGEIALAMTRWTSLNSTEWTHLDTFRADDDYHPKANWSSEFEAAEGLSIAELTRKNMAKLSLERKRRTAAARVRSAIASRLESKETHK